MKVIERVGCGALLFLMVGCARAQLIDCSSGSCGQAATGSPGGADASFSTENRDASSVGDTRDQAVSIADLAQPVVPDLSMPPPPPPPADLASAPAADLAPSCVAAGGSCYYRQNSVCCSNYCIYSTNTCR